MQVTEGTHGASRWLRPFRSMLHWLENVPVSDSVDRRNAPMLQVILLAIALSAPPLWFYRLVVIDIPMRPGEGISLALSIVVILCAAAGFWLIRRGHFQWVLRAFLLVVAISLMLSFLTQGAEANRYESPWHAAWLVMAGLMAGRRALWLMYGWIGTAILVGTQVDVLNGASADAFWVDALISLLLLLFVALLVDRSTSAFRRSLAAAHQRAVELKRAGELLRAETAERERVREQLIHSQKVEAVGRLASGIAHDFNHLLMLVQGYAAKGRGSIEPAMIEESLAGIEAAAGRAMALSRKLTTFCHQGTAEPRSFRLAPVLAALEPMLRQQLGSDIVLDMQPVPECAVLHMDQGQLELIILNLAANARAAMSSGGRFAIAVTMTGSTVALSFADTGEGMPDAVRNKVFEPFFTTRAAGEGAGLGLAVAADVVAAAGGSIEVCSRVGQGTEFELRLPRTSLPESNP